MAIRMLAAVITALLFVGKGHAQVISDSEESLAEDTICVPAEDFFFQPDPAFPPQSYRAHYEACALNNFQLNFALGECRAQLPAPLECSPIQGNELWKPKAESNIGAVVLVSDALQGVPVRVQDSDGNEVTQEIRQVCCPNGGREHRFFDRTGESLQSDAPIFVVFGDERCIRIDNPAVRND